MPKKFNPHIRLRDQLVVKDVLQTMISGYNLEKGFDKINVKEAWSRLLGPGVDAHTSEVYLQNNRLFVSFSSSVLREELSYGKEKIIRMLNEDLGKELIRELIFK